MAYATDSRGNMRVFMQHGCNASAKLVQNTLAVMHSMYSTTTCTVVLVAGVFVLSRTEYSNALQGTYNARKHTTMPCSRRSCMCAAVRRCEYTPMLYCTPLYILERVRSENGRFF